MRLACLGRWLVVVLIVVGGCAPAGESKKVTTPAGAPFYFVQITDTHWGAKDGMAMTRSAVDQINQLPVEIEFVAITGDLFSDSIRKEEIVRDGVEALKGLKAPVYCVPGNHDLIQADFDRARTIFEEHFGPIERKVTVRGVTCVFLSTEVKDGEKRSPAQIEREAVEKMIGATSEPVLIFMHRPPICDLLGKEKGDEPWGDVTDSRWAGLFEKHPGIKGVFAGHFHRDEMCWIGGVPVYAAPALARFWDRQPSYRLYQYKDGRINYWTLYPERPAKK